MFLSVSQHIKRISFVSSCLLVLFIEKGGGEPVSYNRKYIKVQQPRKSAAGYWCQSTINENAQLMCHVSLAESPV